MRLLSVLFFFFQAEDGIRDVAVTGVQTCALPIYFEGVALERALTLPADHRTSAFRPLGHQHRPVYSWYLRLWPWDGNDLLYGLLRIEARAHPASVAQATALSGWLLRERAPVSTPDARWDRLLYPIHDVETYLRSRAPRDLLPAAGSRLPQTGS